MHPALELLQRHGWRPGMSTAEHPDRQAIKFALNRLRDEGIDPRAELGHLVELEPELPPLAGEE